MMDAQIVLNWFFGAAMAVGGWYCKTIWDAIDRLKRDIKDIEVALPEKYVAKIDIEKRFDRIDATLNAIWGELKQKADK